jgi:nucleoside-diphosphate-sugar epimerase
MNTILGAGGVIAREVSNQLLQHNQSLRLVSRNPKPFGNAVLESADLSDYRQTLEAVKGSSVVYLLPGLKYDIRIWRELWPKIMRHTIDACKAHNARLIFFDNIYCLGKVNGPMTEATPFNPISKKGEVRARIATQLLDEISKGNINAMIARSADFYGPDCKTSVFNTLVTDKFAKGKKAQWLVNDTVKHSFTYTPDCGKALWLLSQQETAWNQVWHMPTAHPAITGKELITLAANYFGVKPRYTIISKFMGKLGGLFSTLIKEVNEMTYQNDSDYIFDSTKIEKAFGIIPTSYEEGMKATVKSYRK